MKKKLVVLMSFLLFGITSPLWAAQTITVHFVNATPHTITLSCDSTSGHDCGGNLPSTVSNNTPQNWDYACASSGDVCPTKVNPEKFSALIKKIQFHSHFFLYKALLPYRKIKDNFWVISSALPSAIHQTNRWPYAMTVYFYIQGGDIKIAICRGQQNNCPMK